jgi:thiamine biosynthesis lipoprotein
LYKVWLLWVLFDITSGILPPAWKFDQGKLLKQSLIDELLDKVGRHRVCWKRPELIFSVSDTEIDFSGWWLKNMPWIVDALCYAKWIKQEELSGR